MISNKLQQAINAQIVAEMWSANLYLSMSYYFAAKGYEGFAKWMKAQANEENEHAEQMAQYILRRGGEAKVGAIDAVPQEWDSPLAVFEHVYKHECHVSSLIDALVDLAIAEKDKASQDFLMGFVREQVEEEATAQGIVDKMKLGGQSALYHLDAELGTRK
ncbi:MAG: ferritin [Prevotellaceae bacterium]|nr:ferritin [Prevotellaceae bacterium]